MAHRVPARQIRAVFTDQTITVYQAYSRAIAGPAISAGRFVPPFKRDRMTWIKPSLLWMAYRSGWATKPGQERILAIEITRATTTTTGNDTTEDTVVDGCIPGSTTSTTEA